MTRKSEFGLSFLHTNIRSLRKNFTETRLSEGNAINLIPQLPRYCFEFVQTPLSAGGVGFFINESCNYCIVERVSNSSFQLSLVD